ncbi:MAG: cell division protein ZapA [Amylibacter sp.]|nr:cell division protein ZapA [Amylibacter sp.]
MPEITIHIGGRDFEVVCKKGEEPFLQSAAALLDIEAQALTGAMGRIPEARMLLMSGLMLADKTASLEDQLATADRANEGGPLTSEITEEIAKLKGDLKASEANLKTAQDALQGKEKDLADAKANVTAALEAMERMVASIQKQNA